MKKYIVTLTEEERRMLQEMLSRGKAGRSKADTRQDSPKGRRPARWSHQVVVISCQAAASRSRDGLAAR
jgi:hypothetical protein